MPTENCPELEGVEVSDIADFLTTTDDHVRRSYMRDSKNLSEEFKAVVKQATLLELRKLYFSNGLNTNEFYAVIREFGKFFPKRQQSVSVA